MTPDELLRKEAEKWLEQAARDRTAAHALANVEPSRSVFHSQQAAEKALKAFLTFRQIAFRRTHDLTDLGSQCAAVDPTLEPILRAAEDLTDYASLFRYPDAPHEPDVDEAVTAISIAEKLCAGGTEPSRWSRGLNGTASIKVVQDSTPGRQMLRQLVQLTVAG